MPSPCTSRGQIVVESTFVMLVLLFFLLLSPAIWKVWINEQHARSETHRRTFYRLALPVVLVPQSAQELARKTGKPLSWFLGHEFPDFPDMPELEGEIPENLKGYEEFSNRFVEGWHWARVEYSSGWQYHGELEISRYAATIRPGWSWMGWPFVPTQETSIRGKTSETCKVRDWFEEGYEATFDDGMIEGLKLDRSPIGDLGCGEKDENGGDDDDDDDDDAEEVD